MWIRTINGWRYVETFKTIQGLIFPKFYTIKNKGTININKTKLKFEKHGTT